MPVKCLIVCANELIGNVVENLFKAQVDLEVVNLQMMSEIDLIQELDRYQPDVLILEESSEFQLSNRLLTHIFSLGQIRVIVLNTHTNMLRVYKKQDVLLTQISDLFSVVLDS